MFAIGLVLVAVGAFADELLSRKFYRSNTDLSRKIAGFAALLGATLMVASLAIATWKVLP